MTDKQDPITHAAPKAAPTRTALPEGWTDCTIEFGNDGPEVVAYGPKRMMTRLAKWLGKYFAQVIAEAAPKAAPAPLSDDTKRLDWMDKDAGERVFHVGADWYTRPTYGQPYRIHKNLRAAIDAALAAQGGKDA